jgi:hypothetical protein
MRIPKVIDIKVGNYNLKTKNVIKYLGIEIDNSTKYTTHIEKVCTRANAIVGAMRSQLSNVRGSSNHARRLYYNIWESVLIYTIPVWAGALKMIKNKKIMTREQRATLTRTYIPYRTVSHAALYMLTSNMSIYIKAQMLAKIYQMKSKYLWSMLADTTGRELNSLKDEIERIV